MNKPEMPLQNGNDALTRHIQDVTMMDEAQDSSFGEVIYAYTRQQALADGVQVEVTPIAREAGIKYPVFLTRSVWEQYVQVPEGVQCQDEQGRLWAILWMLRMAIRKSTGSTLLFQLHVRNDNRERTPPLITLKAECGAKDIDDPQPAITIVLPEED